MFQTQATNIISTNYFYRNYKKDILQEKKENQNQNIAKVGFHKDKLMW